MANNLRAKFEQLAQEPPPTHSVAEVQKEVTTKNWSHTGNSGGGHTGHDGKFTNKKVITTTKTVFNEPPPAKKSLADLP
jgi:hypothetical protein